MPMSAALRMGLVRGRNYDAEMNSANAQVIAEVASQRGRDGIVESSDSTLRFDLGEEHAPTPEHLFAAAYAACFHSALRSAAKTAHDDISGSSVIARVALVDDESGGSRLAIEMRAAIPGVSKEQGERLLRQAHSTCPYSRAVRGNIEVKLSTD
jgi:osmotically inducible protein OsmC